MIIGRIIAPSGRRLKNRNNVVLYPKKVMEALATVMYAGTKKNLVASEMVADTPSVAAPVQDGEPWQVKVVLTFPRNTDPFL